MPAFDAVRHYFRAGSLDETTRRSVGRTLDAILHITLAGCALALLANLAAGLWKTAIGLCLAIVVFSVALVLRRRGQQEAATILTLVAVVGTVQVLVSVGSGSHDYATLLYPVAIIVSALLLDRRLLALSSLLTLSSALGTLVAEDMGLLVTRTTDCYGSIGIEHYADVIVILVATALVSHLVVEGIVRALVAVRESEARLAQANVELEAHNAELVRFAYAISHDLKSPLVTIRVFLGYLEEHARKGDLDRLRMDLRRVDVASARMGRLLDELLELSRVGRLAAPKEDATLHELVEEAARLAEGELLAHNADVTMAIPVGVTVFGERSRLVTVLQNLIANAARFMGEQPVPRVVVGLRDAPAEAGGRIIFVRDNGIGIDPRDHVRIFRLFERLEASGEGTGIGLALVQRIVELHGGRVWVESKGLGQGSTFCFTLARRPGGESIPADRT